MSGQLFTSHGYVKPGRITGKGRYRSTVCAVEGCTNPRRNAQAAKYCDEHATSIDYQLRQTKPVPDDGRCVVCDEPVKQRQPVYRPLFVCREHRHLRELLKKWRYTYNLDNNKIRDLLVEPHCWICTASLKWRFANWGGTAQQGKIHVDHDHRCCPGETSCGNCVRGLTHETCNKRIGYLEALVKDLGTERVHQLIDELTSDR